MLNLPRLAVPFVVLLCSCLGAFLLEVILEVMANNMLKFKDLTHARVREFAFFER